MISGIYRESMGIYRYLARHSKLCQNDRMRNRIPAAGGSSILLALALLLHNPLLAQISDAPAGEASIDSSQITEGEDVIFGVQVEVVTIPVTVIGSDGEFVTDLDPHEFRVLDNGTDQKIEEFELSWDPISLAIVVQNSSRVDQALEEIRRAGILFTELILGETGEAAVITFNREVRVAQEFTEDREKIESALREIKAGPDDVRLSDAFSRAIALLQQRPKDRRKIVIIVSEARDTASSNTPGYVLRGAQQLGISVYTIGLSSLRGMLSRASEGTSSPFPPGVVARPGPSWAPPTPDTQVPLGTANIDMLPLIEELVAFTRKIFTGNPLELYSSGTGGEDYSSRNGSSLENSISRIGRELHSQYLITYRPNNLDKDQFHYIKVTVSRPKVKVRTRPGYMFARRPNRRSTDSEAVSPD